MPSRSLLASPKYLSPAMLETRLSELTPGVIAAPRPQAADVKMTVRVAEAVLVVFPVRCIG